MAAAISDKKALDIIIVNMKKMSSVCNYCVIASGTSTTHVRALSDNIIRVLKLKGQNAWHIEGEREASWILSDFGDVVCHLFLEGTRNFYDLEGLWKKAPQEHFKEKRPLKKAAKKRKK
ncbi:MAG: ribosome silencing factor [Candidatus Omnitrophota bacterium]|nr:ribosome silencing factor [Candidatus Omnitrophota bacterium]